MPVTPLSLVVMLVGSLVYAVGVRRSSRGLRALGAMLIFLLPIAWLLWVALLFAGHPD